MDKEDLLIDVESTVDKARQSTRNLVPWLEDPHRCDCGEYCESKYEYVDGPVYGYTKIWRCPKCDKRYFRDRV